MIFFVPARNGSTRLKGKNTMIIGGKPLIEWTFESLNVLDVEANHVIVSSDDADILFMARQHGYVGIRRPPDLCESSSRMNDVLRHHALSGAFTTHETVCVLYPTSPLRTADQIREACEQWDAAKMRRGWNGEVVGLMSCTPISARPHGLMRIEAGELKRNDSDGGQKFYQSQGQPVQYRANGSIYILAVEDILAGLVDAQLFTPTTVPFVMDEITSLEVDTPDDAKIVEAVMQLSLVRAG